MSELQVIELALERAAQRCRLARAFRGLWVGLLIGASVLLLVLGIYHLREMPSWVIGLATLAPFPCLLIGFVVAGWRKPSRSEVARWLDGRQHLQERLSTALEVASEPEGGRWRDLVVADAAQHAKGLDPRTLFPFHLPKATRWALVLLALGAGLGFVPEYRSKSYLQKKADERNIKEAGKQLSELTRHTLERRTPALEPTQKSLSAVTNVAEQLATKTLTRSDALRDLANVADKLKEQLKELGKDPALRRLEQAARSAGGTDAQTAASLQKEIESLQKQLGSPTGNPEALDKIKKNLEKLQEAARGLADKNSPGTDADRQKMAEALSALSREVQDVGLQIPELDDAIKALAANQTDQFLKDLQAATTDLEKLREMSKTLAQLQQQVEKLGKDLAEQLQRGQPEAAQQTLQKMISQLKSANLTPEQLKNLMDEVTRAVAPASKYGKVGEHLKQAKQQMDSKNSAGAAQSLANASKELEKLMQEMGDAQDLQATLDALKQASSMIGAGQGWRLGRQPGAGKQGSPGSGVGTWAEEGATWNGEWSNGWDNSGVERPDEDPRGITDRGEGELSEALSPTRVKGQFSPGAQMPSITLKGVSIKGQSKVSYTEAATAAQSDAQSALSQDKVPRAYQNAVKEYFDDLKK